jgi:hypothetical protein
MIGIFINQIGSALDQHRSQQHQDKETHIKGSVTARQDTAHDNGDD